ncbi:MAG: hypothetical protein ACJ75J_09995 [Cytophagaceae bacterium]
MISKKYLAFSISCLLIFNPHIITNGCGGGEWEPDENYHLIFSPEILKASTFEPFFMWYRDRFHPSPNFLTDPSDENLKEWTEYFKAKIGKDVLSKLIYSSTEAQAQSYLDFYDGKISNPALGSNTALAYIKTSQNRAFLEYLQFALKCLPHVGGNEWEVPERDPVAINKLITEGNTKNTACKDFFLRMRYGYQLTRLAHYAGDNKKCVVSYDNLVAPLPAKSIMKYWGMSHKAGALKNSGKKGEAMYLFSQVFKHCLSRRIESYTSFSFIYDEEKMNDAFTFCKTPQDKNILLFMEGLLHSEPNIGPMEAIYATEPNSKELEVLLAREITKTENLLSGSDFTPGTSSNIVPLSDFVVSCAKAGNTYRPHFWNFTAAYLFYLENNFTESRKYLALAKVAAGSNELFSDELHLLEILLRTSEGNTKDKTFEVSLLSDLKWLEGKNGLKTNHAVKYIMNNLSVRYEADKNYLYSNLCKPFYAYYDLTAAPDIEIVSRLIEFQEKPVKTEWEKYLSGRFTYQAADLHEIRGSILLSEDKFAEAVKEFKAGKDPVLPADPFKMRINDCHDCDFESMTRKGYTKSVFAQDILDKMNLITSDPANAARYYYELGNAHYNLTHFGNAWMAIDYYRDGSAFEYGEIQPTDFYDCSKAKEYYQKALEASASKEFSARCCFMISKCEQNEFFMTGKKAEDPVPAEYRTYFKMLKDKYADTKFYKEAIEECGNFNYYVKHH